MGRYWIYAVMLILLISFVNAQSITKEGEDVVLKIQYKAPKIIKQTGFEQNFYYEFSKYNETHWEVRICHKNFNANKNKKLKDKSDLNNYPVSVHDKKTKAKKKDKNKLKLKNNECETIITAISPTEMLKLGEDSTEIIISDENVTLIIHPEEKECNGLSCESEIILRNSGSDNITINSDDITVSIEQESTHKIYTKQEVTEYIYDCPNNAPCTATNETQIGYKYLVDTEQSFEVTLQPDETQTFFLRAEMLQTGFFKYNVTFFYNNTYHVIDPYFDVLDETIRAKTIKPIQDSGYDQGDSVEILAGIYTNATIDTVIFRVQFPNASTIDYSPELFNEDNYKALRDDPEGTGTTGALFYSMGDTSWGGNRFWNTMYVIRGHKSGYIDGIDQNNDLVFGDPQAKGFIYDLWICEASTVNQTSSHDMFIDCADTPVLVADDINVSNYWDNTISSATGRKKLDFDIPYYLDSTKNYIYIQDYVGSVNDLNNASDVWLIRLDSAGLIAGAKPYRYTVEEQNGSIGNNFSFAYITDLNLMNNYTWNYTFTNTVAEGTYIVQVIANDTLGNENSSAFVSFNVCTPNYQCVGYAPCLTNDTRFCNLVEDTVCNTTYSGDYSEFPYQSCNYCSADIQKNYTTSCTFINGSYERDYIYIDGNYGCCISTGLPSDCLINFAPYNESSYTESCTVLSNDFEISYNENVNFALIDDRVYWTFDLNNSNTTYRCISYVKGTDGSLLQKNPKYVQQSDSIIHITGSKYEDRDYFEAVGGLGSVYFTSDKLTIDREYIFGIECVGDGEIKRSGRLVMATYEKVTNPITRVFWFTDNAIGIVIFSFLVIVFLAILGWGIWKIKNY